MRRTPLAAALALISLLVAASPAHAKSADVIAADVEMRLAPDASLLVTEHLTFDYQGDFQASFREIPLLFGERIRDLEVREGGQLYLTGGCTVQGCVSPELTFGVDDNPILARVVWHHNAEDETRTFDVSYRVISTRARGDIDGVPAGATVAYDDVIDVAWTVWGDQWDFDLRGLTATFTDSALDTGNDDYRVYGHPRGVEGETRRDDGVARLSATDVQSGTAVEMRITVPREPGQDVSGAREVDGDGLPAIIAFEQQLDDDFNAPWPTFKRWILNHLLLICIGLTGLAVLVMALLMFLARERPVSVPKYLSGPPEEDTGPALAYGLAYEGGDSNNTVLATLLDLTDRGYYVATSASTKEERQDLAIGKSAERPSDGSDLTTYEREVMSFFDDVVDEFSVPVSEMRDRIPKHSTSWNTRWSSMTGALNDAESGELKWDRDLRGMRGLLALFLLAAFGLLLVLDIVEQQEWVLPTAFGVPTLIGIFMVSGRRLRRLSPAERERSAKWQAFARWTEDFPRLADDPPQTLALWKRILVYGVAFGTAERMISSGRIPAPVSEEAATGGAWSTYAFAGGFSSTSFDGGSFSSGFASQVAPESSSTGGGGGFSGGGGGGFSGGGGGGSW